MNEIVIAPELSCAPPIDSSRSTPRYASFGGAQVDLHAGWLFRNDCRTTLPTKCLQVLSMLLERSNDVVSRDDIREQLWPSNKPVDYAANVNTTVNRLRRELGRESHYIKTITGVGYCLAAEVVFSDSRAHSASTQPVNGSKPKVETLGAVLARTPALLLSTAAKVVLTGVVTGGAIMALWIYGVIPPYLTIISALGFALVSIILTVRWAHLTIQKSLPSAN